MDILLTSNTPGAVVTNDTSGATHTHSVSLAVGNQNGVAGSKALDFTVKSLGAIPAKIHIESSIAAYAGSPFTNLLPAPIADVTLNQNETKDYHGGISWPELSNADQGKTVTVTYAITVSEDSGAFVPPLGTFQRDSANQITVRIDHWGASGTFHPGDTLSTYNNAVVAGTNGWNDNLATADASGVIYYRGNGIGTCVPVGPPFPSACTGVAPVGHLQITIKRGGSQLVTPGVL
ncbi:MAG: hypothetical protein ACXVJT_13430 [Thermoanaerobaculia bacterium]